ncbi:ferritin-like domain-containing protein [Daejeonella oryzae]|uniref:ferritin-like domain-containing protein n=1 Tax=Daejeonella oryzae TaxID=1122943 RepID=UPI0003FDEC3C|nr:PA2169 family four-helix-bundle protein [Daejeonella oryzae]
MENTNEKLIDDLNHLLTICNDGKYGYETAAEDADSAALKGMFLAYSLQRADFANVLRQEITKAGGDPDKGGGPLGAIHRAWIDVKSALSSKDNKAVLGACVTGEKAAVSAYNGVLENIGLHSELRSVLNEQRRNVEEALTKVEGLHNTIES